VGGGVFSAYGITLVVQSTIIAANTDDSGTAPDVSGTIALIDHSLVGDNKGSGLTEAQTPDVNGNLIGSSSGSGVIDPKLGPLANNGGPTQTMALLIGSPAYNTGSNPAALTTDQRGAGFPRTLGGLTDIGAFEMTPDITPPSVTINQAAGQLDPTNASPINFTVVFSEVVSDFATGDVTLGGTAGATTAIVTGSGTTYHVAVSGMTGNGTVVASIAAGRAHDGSGNASLVSTSTDNTVSYDITAPTVTINQAPAQLDPTNVAPINFRVVFSEVVSDFATGDVTLGGTAGATTATVTGSGTTYNVAVSGMAGSGTVVAIIAAGRAHDGAGNASLASTSTDNTVSYDITVPTVTINQAAAQSDPANTTPINFTVVFSETVNDFATGDVTLGGTAPGTLVGTVTGSGTTYNVDRKSVV
jgi:hypothetical protein